MQSMSASRRLGLPEGDTAPTPCPSPLPRAGGDSCGDDVKMVKLESFKL